MEANNILLSYLDKYLFDDLKTDLFEMRPESANPETPALSWTKSRVNRYWPSPLGTG